MEGVHCLRKTFSCEKRFPLQDRSERAYFSVPLCMSSRKFVRFTWSGNLFEFLCLCFGLGPAPTRIFSKLLKVPIALLRRLIRLVIYFDNIFLMGRTLEEILMSRDTLIFLLQHLGFAMHKSEKKQFWNHHNKYSFFGLKIDTCTMTLALSEEKIEKVILKWQNLLSHLQTTVLELTKLIGLMSSTV